MCAAIAFWSSMKSGATKRLAEVCGLSAANDMRITGAPPANATRDLASLVSFGALLRTGENKATHYSLNIDSQKPRQIEASDLGSICYLSFYSILEI